MDINEFMAEMDRKYPDLGNNKTKPDFHVDINMLTNLGAKAEYTTDGMIMLYNTQEEGHKAIGMSTVGRLNVMEVVLAFAHFIRRKSGSDIERKLLALAFIHMMEESDE